MSPSDSTLYACVLYPLTVAVDPFVQLQCTVDRSTRAEGSRTAIAVACKSVTSTDVTLVDVIICLNHSAQVSWLLLAPRIAV